MCVCVSRMGDVSVLALAGALSPDAGNKPTNLRSNTLTEATAPVTSACC